MAAPTAVPIQVALCDPGSTRKNAKNPGPIFLEEPMNKKPIEIHPYDFAELIEKATGACVIDVLKASSMPQVSEFDLVEYQGVKYHRTPLAPRADGPHTIF